MIVVSLVPVNIRKVKTRNYVNNATALNKSGESYVRLKPLWLTKLFSSPGSGGPSFLSDQRCRDETRTL